jgi:hypothetical protein
MVALFLAAAGVANDPCGQPAHTKVIKGETGPDVGRSTPQLAS